MNRRHFLSLPLSFGLGITLLRAAQAVESARMIEQDWNDAARKRVVPVRIYLPEVELAADRLRDGPKDAPKNKPMPLILFSHGLGGSRAGGEQWGRLWAAHGFICIHLQHQGSDEALWKDKNPLQGFASLRRAMTAENGVLRAQDVTFALDEITRRKKRVTRRWATLTSTASASAAIRSARAPRCR